MEKPKIEDFNVSLMQLSTDISKAINDYLKRGNINFASIVGVLEELKSNVMFIARKANPKDRVIFQRKPPEYIG